MTDEHPAGAEPQAVKERDTDMTDTLAEKAERKEQAAGSSARRLTPTTVSTRSTDDDR